MSIVIRRCVWLCFAVVTLSLLGCGGNAQVKGTCVLDGQPYTQTEEMVALTFTKTDGSLSPSCSIQANGSFIVPGPNNDGLPPGTYKVGFYSDVEGKGKKRIKDLTPDKSTFELVLNGGERIELLIDLIKGTIVKK